MFMQIQIYYGWYLQILSSKILLLADTALYNTVSSRHLNYERLLTLIEGWLTS